MNSKNRMKDLWKVFLKIDLWKVFLRIEEVIPDRKVTEEADEYTLPAPVVDGNCLVLVYPVSG